MLETCHKERAGEAHWCIFLIYFTEVIRTYLCIFNNYSACNSHYYTVAVLGFENWVGQSGTIKRYIYAFFYLKSWGLKKRSSLITNYSMDSIIHCKTSYNSNSNKMQLLPYVWFINIFLDHKKTRWAKQKSELAKKLDRPINWVGQTLSWMGQCPAGPPAAPPQL